MISFHCSHCGLKFQVKPEFAGRSSHCPTCKQPLVVPFPSPPLAEVAAGHIDGTDSSLAKAGVDGGVTLEQSGAALRQGQRSIKELLARRPRSTGRYIIEGEIARGGMGSVLRAVDCDIRREVAVKYLLNQSDAGKKLRFIEEAQITGQLEHPNIVPIHELGIDALNRLFFSMKMVKGLSLAQVLDQLRQNPKIAEKEFSLGRLLNIFVNVCNALAYAHSRGVVHRDLKPANIMIGDFGEVYIMDWGLAKVLKWDGPTPEGAAPLATPIAESPSTAPVAVPMTQGSVVATVVTSRESEADLTQEGAVLGTPVYMPPEQASGNVQAIDQRSDIYSLGAILYEMLTLQPPIDKQGGYLAILMRVMQGEIVPPDRRARAGKVPRELSAIAMKALARQPQDRYANVEALRRDIERFQEGRSVSAKEDTTREMLVKFVKRNKAFSVTTLIALLVLLVVLGFTLNNYLDFLKQRERTRQAVPAFLRASRLAVNDRQFKDALDQATVAVDYDPDNADAHLFKGKLLIVQQQFPQARRELETYQKLRPGDGAADRYLKLCQQARAADVATCLAFAELFTEQKEHGLADGTMRGFGANAVEARNKLLQMYRQRIEEKWPTLGTRLSVDSAGRFTLNFGDCGQVSDLGPLKGMPLSTLNLGQCRQVRDLSPLHDMPLAALNLTECIEVRDLTPLQGMGLTSLSLAGCLQVQDLTPMHGMALTFLDLSSCPQIRDLSVLKGMPLTSLGLYRCRGVRDLSPLQGMSLVSLNLESCSEIRDLTPLQGMKLTSLNLTYCGGVRDLTPLQGMKLTVLDLLSSGELRDLTPLQGMNLTEISLVPRNISKGMDMLRHMKSLKVIAIGYEARYKLTSEEFWKRYDAGEFNK